MLDGGRLTAAAKAVIDIVADYDAVLATGHLSEAEIRAVVDYALGRGHGHLSEAEIRAVVDYALGRGHGRIVVTHPEMQCPNLSIDTQIELARAGCLMEYCAVNCMPMFQSVTSDQMKEAIDAVGPENAVIATDSGQPFSPKLPDMFRSFAQVLYEKGSRWRRSPRWRSATRRGSCVSSPATPMSCRWTNSTASPKGERATAAAAGNAAAAGALRRGVP